MRQAAVYGVGIIADALPFLLWARGLQALDATPIGLSAAAAGLLLPLKIALHVVVFQAMSVDISADISA